MNDVMTPREAGLYLRFHLVSIYKLIKRKQLPFTKIGGQWRIRKSVLDEWMEKRMVTK
ncbi:helix-turn-helix domain-containing protein [Candidatus Parcubacteria bacterium]|nr:helix-turn-helix domain-containing protein [Candidatus Parcubacteria bacterium]